MLNSALESVVSNPALPSLPVVALEVLELTARADVDLTDIERAIERDQAMAAKVLKTINSSYYGLSERCGNIRQAVAFLGLETIKNLVLGFSLVRVADGGGADEVTFDFIDYWRRSFFCASVARELAKVVKGVDPDGAFIGALVQDVGMVALWRVYGDRYLQIIDMTNSDHDCITEIERRILNTDHAEVGAEMTRRWRLPKSIIEAIRRHQDPLSCMTSAARLARVVRLAGVAVKVLESDVDSTKTLMTRFQRQTASWFELKPDQVRDLLESASERARSLASALDICAGEIPSIEEILDRAEQVRSELPQVGLPELEESRVGVDSTTGLPERARLLTDLESLFAANGGQTPLSLLLLGIDEVRALNERLGDSGGDAALEHVAECVREVLGFCRCRTGAYRFVGAEIAVTLEGLDESSALTIAEELRATIACRPARIESRDGESELCSVHVTIGVGAHHPGGDTMMTASPDGLLRASMCAVTAGRRLGGDRVHVYEDEHAHRESSTDAA